MIMAAPKRLVDEILHQLKILVYLPTMTHRARQRRLLCSCYLMNGAQDTVRLMA